MPWSDLTRLLNNAIALATVETIGIPVELTAPVKFVIVFKIPALPVVGFCGADGEGPSGKLVGIPESDTHAIFKFLSL